MNEQADGLPLGKIQYPLLMKRNVLILKILLLIAFLSEAQVTIGIDREPHPGAILELESHSNRGLLLPYISLSDAKAWSLQGEAVEGMAVYNTSNLLKGKGFYVWIEGQWCIAQQTSCQGTPSIGTISVSSTDIPVNVIFQALVDPSDGAVQYIWMVSGSADLVGYSNTNVISLAGTKAGYAEIKVKAVYACGTTATSEPQTITIK
jgi:hypothetical protein